MKNKKLFKYIPITIMTAGVVLTAFVTPPYFINNSGTPATQVFNDNQQVNDADYTDQLDYIRSDVAKQDEMTNPIKSIKLASKDFSMGYSTAAIVTKMDGSTLLYTWGRNTDGQLGLGHWTSVTKPTRVTFFSSSPIAQIALGGYHSAALLEDGSLYTWGDNSYGQLGLGSKISKYFFPEQVTFFRSLPPITQIALGGDHSAALLKDGSLYTWGNNNNGRLGLGNTDKTLTPTQVPSFSSSPITQIALGLYHSAALLEDDTLYTWGTNDSGQLGLGNKESKVSPAQVTFFSSLAPITQIVLGNNHSAALLKDGSLYTWGSNTNGQLGLDNTHVTLAPTEVTFFSSLPPITQIALGGYHSAALLEDDTLYTWGYNIYGQLGLSDSGSATTKPTKVPSFSSSPITQIALGNEHSAAITENGSLYTWGRNNNSQLGLGDSGSTTFRLTPTWMPYLGKDSHITANDTITAKKAVDSFWVNGIFDPEGFKNSFNLINIPDVADQEITMDTEPTYDSAATVTMKVKFEYFYDANGLAVTDTSTTTMTISGFKPYTVTTNITALSEYRADLTPTNFKEQLEKDGAVVAGDQYTLGVTNITFLKQFLKIEDVSSKTICTLSIDPNQTDDATGVLSFTLSLNQYYSSDGTLKTELYDKTFNLNLLPALTPTPVEWWWILVGIGGAAIIGALVWYCLLKSKKNGQLAAKRILQQRSATQAK